MPPAPVSLAKAATSTEAALLQAAAPPLTVTAGAVRSSRTSAGADHAEALPARSVLRYSTWV